MCLSQLCLTGRDADAATQAVDQPMASYRHQPGSERPLRVVSMADGVNGHQYILHSVLDLISGEAAAAGESPQLGGYRLQENEIGSRVAFLSALQQRRPVVTSRLITARRPPRLFIERRASGSIPDRVS